MKKLLTILPTFLTNESGQAFILAIGVLVIVIVTTMVLISGAYTYSTSSKYSVDSMQATQLAEAGIDHAVAALNKSAGSYTGEPETVLGSGSYSVSVTSVNNSTYLVQATGYVPNKAKPKSKRTISIQISKGTGISFVYGMLMGTGGISMGNGSAIHGAVYSNGNIVGGNNETIDGDVFVAGGTQPNADQQNICVAPNCTDFLFGKNVSGQNQLDVAQSFQISTTSVINKISLKLKKVGSPANITVRILGDNAGKPNKNNVLTSGVLSANLVTTQYGFVDVTFTSTPTLNAGTPYWIVLDTSSNSSNYWSWSEDTLPEYTSGNPAWSADWQSNNPNWTILNGNDFDFKIWTGGVITSIVMNNGSVIGGNVHANTINGITINKDAYYQTITNSTVNGASHPGSTDPPPVALPISDSNIAQWQADAEEYGTSKGDVTGCPASIGPGKIIGNIVTTNNCNITVNTPVWLTGTGAGNMINGNSVIYKMNPNLGNSSGVMIIDGTTSFANGDDLLGTGVAGSYLTLLSTFDSP